MPLSVQITWLFILAIPIASIAWTVTHEEVFKEPREFCIRCSRNGGNAFTRKFFYLFTCEYCFSHYVTIGVLLLTGYKLLLDDWRGYIIAAFSLVWIANIYMSLFGLIKLNVKGERIETNIKEESLKQQKADGQNTAASTGDK